MQDPVKPALLFLGTEFGLSFTVDGGAHCGYGFGRGPECIFVGGELDNLGRIDAERAGGFVDRFAGLVYGKIAQLPIRASDWRNLLPLGRKTQPSLPRISSRLGQSSSAR